MITGTAPGHFTINRCMDFSGMDQSTKGVEVYEIHIFLHLHLHSGFAIFWCFYALIQSIIASQVSSGISHIGYEYNITRSEDL